MRALLVSAALFTLGAAGAVAVSYDDRRPPSDGAFTSGLRSEVAVGDKTAPCLASDVTPFLPEKPKGGGARRDDLSLGIRPSP